MVGLTRYFLISSFVYILFLLFVIRGGVLPQFEFYKIISWNLLIFLFFVWFILEQPMFDKSRSTFYFTPHLLQQPPSLSQCDLDSKTLGKLFGKERLNFTTWILVLINCWMIGVNHNSQTLSTYLTSASSPLLKVDSFSLIKDEK